jgi:hypothetical protein
MNNLFVKMKQSIVMIIALGILTFVTVTLNIGGSESYRFAGQKQPI